MIAGGGGAFNASGAFLGTARGGASNAGCGAFFGDAGGAFSTGGAFFRIGGAFLGAGITLSRSGTGGGSARCGGGGKSSTLTLGRTFSGRACPVAVDASAFAVAAGAYSSVSEQARLHESIVWDRSSRDWVSHLK